MTEAGRTVSRNQPAPTAAGNGNENSSRDMLILDDRETDIAPYLKAFDVPVSITRLDSGDARWEA